MTSLFPQNVTKEIGNEHSIHFQALQFFEYFEKILN